MDDAARWWAPAAVVAAALVVPFLVRLVLSVPDWVTLVALAVSVAGAVAVVRQIGFQREQRALRVEAARAQQVKAAETEAPPREEHHVPAIPVDSAEPYYRFTLSCTVCWRPHGPLPQHANPRGLAVHAVLERARQVTVQGSPTDPDGVQVRLAAELGAQLSDRTGQITAWAEDVGLTVPPEDAERLKRLQDVRKEKQIRDHERELEQAARAYLTSEVLSDPGKAVVWWLARHPEQVREAAELLPTFAQLSAAAHGTEVYLERQARPQLEESD
ncbi:hypothetical protein [Actinokineospora sp. UTMC 2448]|uniref:hypothetical protein n=1 Tax=Actinokineospora sp. UTMC 2448 TaxID=2268449 RepID=UPI0021642AB6|nr:hypothetical protein [Actinokineospora sp. UTMC 2448]